ncbi:methenyltetrahydrofolate synthase domain-containing protein isoform X5 [Cervus elaphus]|uniref:methenyltetrahydrofolate synthase domain-containing protein isoform X5 n=1 Tax=Cervus elaphus TaxID=9860 RepID=UPI001CC2B40E|nr:methenyltetrahydrofolate synthase domain-containing protein isoform X5 [Cervus elaphus]
MEPRAGEGPPRAPPEKRAGDTEGPHESRAGNAEGYLRDGPGVSKQDIREQIWDYMESQNLADFPRPVHHRIPNFKGSYLACQNIRDLEVFARTQELKVDPDKPLEGVRLLALQSKKTLLVPTPRLRTGLFNKITPPPGATKDILRKCATSQVVDIPEALLEDHDLTVDYILTPTRVITTGCERPKPAGIAWSKISCEMMEKIPILRSLRHREEQAGKDVTLRDGPRSTPGAQAAPSTARSPQDPAPPESGSVPPSSVEIGNLPRDVRVSQLKRALSALGVVPSRLTWQGPQHRAFLHYRDPAEAQQAIACLQGFRLGASTVRVVLARQQRAGDLGGGHTAEPLPDHRPLLAHDDVLL